MQTIGVTDISITYSRPGVKGRTIWGDPPADAPKGEATLDDSRVRPAGMPIVPYGHMWRTGANEATQFVVTDDVLVNGQKLAAGSYSLHTIPGKDEWTIIFNGNANQWGSFNYDPKNDTLRVKTKAQTVADNQEWLAFTIDPAKDNSAIVNIRWEKVRVPFTVEVADVVATTLARARVSVAASKADDWRSPFQAAMYANQNKATDDAAKWFEQALARVDASIAAKETFDNLVAKTNVLLGSGRRDEALAVADKAIARGKADKADTAAFEKRVADLKAGKN
jgi:tetratricopeptide (TPR) repeat protein